MRDRQLVGSVLERRSMLPIVRWMRWRRLSLGELRGITPLLIVISLGISAVFMFIGWKAFSAYRTLKLVPTIYHKEWTFGFIRDFHEKTGGWPRSWQSLEQTIDVRSPFPFADITRSVSVRWENLGTEIDLRTDWYLKTESNLNWQGQDVNRELLQYIHAANHPDDRQKAP